MAGNAASFRPPTTRTGKAPMGVGDLMLNPLDFKAVGDGSSNDSARVQAAIDEAAQIGGGCGVIIPRGRFYIPDGIDLTVPGVSLFSRGGVLGTGRIRVGSDVGQDFSETILDNIRYDGNAPYDPTKKAITLRNARGLTIKDPKIKRTGKAISVDSADGASGFHTLGMVRINGFKSSEVDYSIYSNTATWDVCSDWHVTDSVSNFARICNFRFAGGIDGLIFDDITAFMLNYSSTSPIYADKTYNLWIDKAEQLHIDTANLFEAGLAGIRIDELGIFSMNGVNVTWPGQLVQSDAIEINGGNMRGAILGGSLSNWTRSAIGIHGGDASRLEIGTIGLRWLSTMESWKGTGTLSTANCFRYTVDPLVNNVGVTGLPAIRDYTNGMDLYDSIKGRTQTTSRDRKATWSGLAAATRRNISVVPQQDGQGNPVGTAIFLLSDMMEANVYGGTLTVFARSSAVSTAKVATYVLAISSSDPKCELIKAVGSTSGTAADDPSFTWSIVNNELRATPVGATGGSGFWFDGVATGALGLR